MPRHALRFRVAAACMLFVLSFCAQHAAGVKHPSNVHTIFLVECNLYFTWQSLGMYYSHAKSGQPGPITRVFCCDDDSLAKLEKQGLLQKWRDLGPTHMAPSYSKKNPHNDDHYSAYNKPLAVMDFLEKAEPEEDWILILDADMILRLPYVCQGEDNGEDLKPFELPCQRSHPIAAHYGYLKGSTNKLALKHLPDPEKRNDREGGQDYGRYADQVGGVFFVHKEDMKLYMHDWLTYTEAVRYDPDAWELSGDSYTTHPGDKPWISEMYGYVFSAAKHKMWHKIDPSAMIYPENASPKPHRIMHYGLTFGVNEWKFDKHWHYDFDPLACAPWGDVSNTRGTKGVFAHAPRISTLKSKEGSAERVREYLAIETLNVLNEAFCEHHRKNCPGILENPEYKKECQTVADIAEEVRLALAGLDERLAETGGLCGSEDARCATWAKQGECEKNFSYMSSNCPTACKNPCLPFLPPAQRKSKPQALAQSPVRSPEPQVHKEEVAPDAHKDTAHPVLSTTSERAAADPAKLRHACLQQQGLTLGELEACLTAASEGRVYTAPEHDIEPHASVVDLLTSTEAVLHGHGSMSSDHESNDDSWVTKQRSSMTGWYAVGVWAVIVAIILVVARRGSGVNKRKRSTTVRTLQL